MTRADRHAAAAPLGSVSSGGSGPESGGPAGGESAAPLGGAGRGPAPLVVVMGVSGSGKTTVGVALGRRLGVPFADADDFHSAEGIAKMSRGVPLDDGDRMPWLRAIGAWLAGHAAGGAVASCSALKRSYREVLREAAPGVCFVHLDGDAREVRRRVAGRLGHFMPESLVESQLATLEPLEADEPGVVLDLGHGVEELVEEYLAAVARGGPCGGRPGRGER
ncbi:hypothetical protein Ssi03_04110 [Sphaerisporangium siamense]|nr:hypothetical protein Ssi03_04110 [Sphaerisporangium siamense]